MINSPVDPARIQSVSVAPIPSTVDVSVEDSTDKIRDFSVLMELNQYY